MCSSDPESSDDTTNPTVGTTSRPDQPGSHLPPAASESDPLRGVKIPCYGDQLTRVRFAGGRDLRAGCHSAKQRLDHLYPFCIVDWHSKKSFLKVLLYSKNFENSGQEKGTLCFFREKLNRRNVTADVKHYEDCEQLFLSVGKCFVIEALLEFFHMDDIKHKPTANGPHSVHVLKEEYRKTYILQVINIFLDEYVFVGGDEVSDGVWCCGVNLMKCFMLLADFKDAVSTGN
ncbi:Hypothetical predicted protein, partial [Paramuricea clavata]